MPSSPLRLTIDSISTGDPFTRATDEQNKSPTGSLEKPDSSPRQPEKDVRFDTLPLSQPRPPAFLKKSDHSKLAGTRLDEEVDTPIGDDIKPMKMDGHLISSIFDLMPHVLVARPDSDPSPNQEMTAILLSGIKAVQKARKKTAGTPKLENLRSLRSEWTDEVKHLIGKSKESFHKPGPPPYRLSDMGQACRLNDLALSYLEKLKSYGDSPEKKLFLKNIDSILYHRIYALSFGYFNVTGNYLSEEDAQWRRTPIFGFDTYHDDGLEISDLWQNVVELNQKCLVARGDESEIATHRASIQALMDKSAHLYFEGFDVHRALYESESATPENMEDHFKQAVMAMTNLQTISIADQPGIMILGDDSPEWNSITVDDKREAASASKLPEINLDGQNIASLIKEILGFANGQMHAASAIFEEPSLNFKYKLKNIRDPLSKMDQASHQMKEIFNFIRHLPAENEEEAEKQLKLLNFIDSQKILIDLCIEPLRDYQRIRKDALARLEADERDLEAQAAIDRTPDGGSSAKEVDLSARKSRRRPPRRSLRSETISTPTVDPTTLETTGSSSFVPAAESSLPIDEPEQAFDADRLSESDYRHDWIFDMLESLRDLSKPADRSDLPEPAGARQRLNACAAERKKTMDQATALEERYRVRVVSYGEKGRVAAVEQELISLVNAAHANMEMAAAWDKIGTPQDLETVLASKKDCLLDLNRCLARAAALEDVLERPAILHIPDQATINAAMGLHPDGSRNEDVADPSTYVSLITPFKPGENSMRSRMTGVELNVSLSHRPGNGRQWLERQGKDAGLLDFPKSMGAKSGWALVPIDRWELHPHVPGVADPSSVDRDM
ncbi:MAG: hypothetical protein ABW032_03105, partial [Burkholderiaceae bacterium]